MFSSLGFLLIPCVAGCGLNYNVESPLAGNKIVVWSPQGHFQVAPCPSLQQDCVLGTGPPSPETSDTRPLVMGYYSDWASGDLPPEKIDFTHFDWIDFAFALPDETFRLVWDDPDTAPDLLRRLVNAAHAKQKKVKLSVGGWTGSKYFSEAVATPGSRQSFVQNIAAVYRDFNLDGIDIDWEYPGRAGAAGNHVNANDTENFLLFLRLLRASLPPTAKLSAAAVSSPFVDSRGHPMKNTTEFASILDWILIMNYDNWGSSSNPGPNAPLYDSCGNSTQPDANAIAAFESWTASGFPSNKLVLGLPTYGYISNSTATHLRTRNLDTQEHYFGRIYPQNLVKVLNTDGDSDGQVPFQELVRQGALSPVVDPRTGDRTFEGTGGYERDWDACSGTPFLRSLWAEQVITYDDTRSIGMKALYSQKVGMLGINFFDLSGDTREGDLVNAAIRALGTCI
ncbi:glycoside hydrolase family 18 protein [Amanita muscaria Koide BX008]|uniref:Glycoside hydrolase family 18 protein n=1 Tax=Amanita muscaria (strain Koide BX008) TaxID=946122 RepID=A0A0C2TLU1_AMAMK|nr:glycoside hydrolase family 18 protein [Amanita muscaria Koide BX008]